MFRLEWNGKDCVNPPEGWQIKVYWERIGMGFFWQAVQTGTVGAQYAGANVATEAEARLSCEAALLRLGVLEPGGEFVTAARLILDFGGRANDRAVVAIAAVLAALEVEAAND